VDALCAYFERWNRGDAAAVMSLFTEDVEVVGFGACPCRGKQDVLDNFVRRTLGGGFALVGPSPIAVAADRARSPWRARIELPGGARELRGWMEIVVRGSLICELRGAYDLADPQTVVARTLMGDVVFALDRPGRLEPSGWRAIVIPLRQGVRVSVIHARAAGDGHEYRALIRGPAAVHELAAVRHGQSVTRLDASFDELVAQPHHVVIVDPAGQIVASAVIPAPAPAPVP
jgi:hypothetical protein